jgi:DNA-binding IclR family transcriptional regulator
MAAGEAWHVQRTMQVLELLAFGPRSVPQLATAMYAQPRTIRRFVNRLVEEEFVSLSDERRRLYEPTMRLVALAGQIVENSPLTRVARPYVTLLRERTNASAHLVVPSYQSALCLVHAGPCDADIRPRLRELVPAHCTAGGKVLLAWRDRWRESVLAAPLGSYTDRTIVEPGALRRMLDQVRLDGHAAEDREYQPDVCAVAVPVLVAGDAVAALAASGRAVDLDAARGATMQIARDLSHDLLQGRCR